jgi:hypothetical protein
MSTHDETICGATRNEGRLNSPEVEGDIGDLFDDLPLFVALVVIIRVKRVYLAKSRCESLRTHGGMLPLASLIRPGNKTPPSSCSQLPA